MKTLNFSIGILSWKGYASLYNSLKSYEENGLNSLTQSKFICLPEYNNEGIKICKDFGYKPILFKKKFLSTTTAKFDQFIISDVIK